MKADEVIESYVTDVAARLPRKQRNDVAFELRALLNEELQARAEAAGRGADAVMAIELLRDFGRPADVAARYQPTLTIIDPADGHRFLQAAVIGLVVIWCVGLLAHLRHPINSGWDVLTVLGQWWGGTVTPSLWWPGVLVVGFGAAAWTRRRWPQTAEWRPRTPDSIPGGRATMVLGLFGMVLGLYVLVNPQWVLDFFWGGRAAPAAYVALTYTDAFLRHQAPFLLVLILINIPLNIAVIVSGRRSALLQRIEMALGLLTCAAMMWTVAGGPILMTSNSDRTAKLLMVLIVAVVLPSMGIRLYRSVKPTPDRQIQVPR
jgi:hypothetical protein